MHCYAACASKGIAPRSTCTCELTELAYSECPVRRGAKVCICAEQPPPPRVKEYVTTATAAATTTTTTKDPKAETGIR